MDMEMFTQLMNDWLGLVIDVSLMLGFFFLWLSWHRNGSRQRQLEALLLETANQLEEATQHLALATQAIEQIKQQEQTEPSPPVAPCQPSIASPVTAQAPTQTPAQAISTPPQHSTQATMILRMQREGESPETIADRLDLPLAQVKLMLKLHAAKLTA